MMMKSLQNIFLELEPLLRRVVQEEVERGLEQKSPRLLISQPRIEMPPPPPPPSWRLVFKNLPLLPIFTGSKIEDTQKGPLRILLVSDHNSSLSELPAVIKIEVVVLDGDFPSDDQEDWTGAEFTRGIVNQRAGKRPLLTGDVNLVLRGGSTVVSELQFTDNSSWIRSRNFRIAARVVPGSYDGPRIKEAMTSRFVVRDHRGELYRKHHPPYLGDEVWRLEKIGKDGAFHRKLSEQSINTVQDFLKLLEVDPGQLRLIMGPGMSDKMWEATIRHAKTCVVDDRIFMYSGPQCAVYVDSICRVKKIAFGNMTCTLQDLNRSQKNYVQHLVREAYQQWRNLPEADGAYDDANPAPIQNEAAISHGGAAPQPWYPGSHENAVADYQLEGLQEVGAPSTSYQWGHMYNMTG